MKIASLAYINFMDNELKQKIVEVEDNASWKDVFVKCYDIVHGENEPDFNHKNDAFNEWVLALDDDLEKARFGLIDSEIDIIVTFYETSDKFLEK